MTIHVPLNIKITFFVTLCSVTCKITSADEWCTRTSKPISIIRLLFKYYNDRSSMYVRGVPLDQNTVTALGNSGFSAPRCHFIR